MAHYVQMNLFCTVEKHEHLIIEQRGDGMQETGHGNGDALIREG
jgi:hypothetical protein